MIRFDRWGGAAVCALAVCSAAGRPHVEPATPEELQYFRYLLMTIGSPDYSRDAIDKTEGALAYQFGADAREAGVIHAAGARLRTILTEMRGAGAAAAMAELDARREQAIAELTGQILESIRPETAARMRMPGRITARALAPTRANPAAIPSGTPIADLTDFQSCLASGWNQTHTVNYGDICQLGAGVFQVPCSAGTAGCGAESIAGPLKAARSGTRNSPVWILGTATGGTGDTVLRRSSKALKNIMTVGAGINYVDIDNLTFDGNRYGGCESIAACGAGGGLGLNCLLATTDDFHADLNAGNGGVVTIQNVNFINAPWIALILAGPGSTLSYANLGFGSASETAAQTATRATGVFLMGAGSGVYYSNIYYAGGAAINLYRGSNQTVYGNTINQDQYELSYAGCQYGACPPGGGQLFIDPATTNATVAANVIDGNGWQTPADPAPINGCRVAGKQSSLGVEAYGNGHRFFNNAILRNMSSGMALGGSNPTNDITISGINPWDANDTPRYIEQNGWGGIRFLGPKTCGKACPYTSSGVILSHLRVKDNHTFGVDLDGVSGPGFWEGAGWAGHPNDACMYGNARGDVCSHSLDQAKCSPRDPGFAAGNQTIHNVAKGSSCPAGY